MRTVTVVILAFSFAISARAEGVAGFGHSLIIDCSGCNENEKSAAASTSPNVLLLGNASQRNIYVDVTDLERGVINRYQVTLSRSKERITRRVAPVDVPLARKEAFAKAREVLDTIEFIRPGKVGISVPGARTASIKTSYPSAFDLIDDNGYQEVRFSKSLNMTTWPNPESAALGHLDFGEVVSATLPVVEDYLEGRTALVTEAKDGTLIIVEATIAMGLSGTSVFWQIAEDGLRRADGKLIHDVKKTATRIQTHHLMSPLP